MTECPDLSLLVDVEVAAAFRALDVARHVAGCVDCQTLLSDLEQVHDAATAPELDEARAAAIVATVVPPDVATSRRPPRAGLMAALFTLSLVTVLIVASVGNADVGASSPVLLLGSALLVSGALTRHLARAGA